MATNASHIEKELRASDALLPLQPMDCLERLETLFYTIEAGTADEKAQYFLIKTRAYLETDQRSKANDAVSKGLSLLNVSRLNKVCLRMWQAYVLCYQSKPELAKEILLDVINEFEILEEAKFLVEAKIYYALVLLRSYAYSESLELLFECYRESKKNNYVILMAKSSSCIFSVHYMINDFEDAAMWLDRALVFYTKINHTKEIVMCLLKKGNMFYQLKDFDKSIEGYQEAIEWLDKSKVDWKLLRCMANASLADAYMDIPSAKSIEAYELYLNSIEIAEEVNHLIVIPHLLLGVTHVLLKYKTSEYPFSPILNEEWFELKLNSSKVSSSGKSLIFGQTLWKACSNYYRYKENYKESIKYMDMLMDYNEKLLKKEKIDSVKILQIKNKLQKKELELKNMELKQKEELEKINKNLENKVNERTETLKIKNQELEEYAYIVAHDLKEPIRSIVGFSQILERKIKGVISDEDLELFSFIKNSGIHMGELVNGLLEYSTLNINKDDFVIGNLNKIIAVVLADIRFLIEENQPNIRIAKLPKEIKINKFAIKQLFQNLITNAIKFRKKEEQLTIKISCEEQENTYLISVADNGIGINKEYYDIIFKLFNRLHKNKGYEGTGIGLSVSKKIIELHGGEIWLESKVGEGTTFYFTLPKQLSNNNV